MKCDTKGCRNDMDLTVVGKNMCNDCWKKKCQRDLAEWEVQNEQRRNI